MSVNLHEETGDMRPVSFWCCPRLICMGGSGTGGQHFLAFVQCSGQMLHGMLAAEEMIFQHWSRA